MRKRWILGIVGVLALALSGCGGGDSVPPPSTAPLLTVTYTLPNTSSANTVQIFSDLSSDGDIAYDPVRQEYLVTKSPPTVWFGIDSLDVHLPEYRAFLTFPLNGITNQPIVPRDAVIVSADIEVFVDFLDFATFVPTFLDLVQYEFRNLTAADFDTPWLATRSPFNFLLSDVGNFVRIEVTSLMQAALVDPPLPYFQVRFSSIIPSPGLVGLNDLGDGVPVLSPSVPSRSSSRKVVESPRTREGVVPQRNGTAAKPLSPPAPDSRRR